MQNANIQNLAIFSRFKRITINMDMWYQSKKLVLLSNNQALTEATKQTSCQKNYKLNLFV